MSTVLVGIMQPPSADRPVHWPLPVGCKNFSVGAATISVCAPFYIGNKRALREQSMWNFAVTEAIIQLSRPSKARNFYGANCLSEDMDGLPTTVWQQYKFIAPFPLKAWQWPGEQNMELTNNFIQYKHTTAHRRRWPVHLGFQERRYLLS